MNIHAVREHQRIKRTLIEIEKNSLLERDPSLINLPIPIPSIPILGPILTGLVGGEADSTTAATTATATATAIVTTTAPQTSTSGTSDSGSGENNGGSNNNGNGNGSGSGSNGGSSVNGGSGSSSVDAGSSPTVTVSSVASDSLDPSGTSTPRSSGSGSGSGTVVHSSSGIPTVTSTDANGSVISGSGTSSASQTTNTIINVDAGAKPATQALVLGSSTSGSGALTTVSGSPGSTVSGKSTSTSTAPSSVGSGSSSGGTSGSETDSGTTLSSSATSHHGLSTTAIAGISAIIGVLLICLIIFFARRRYVARRSERRNRWWTAGSGSGASVRTVTSSTRGSGDATVGSGTLTARSSFATNFDHGLTPSNPTFDFEYVSASLGLSPPPMAEVRGGAVSPSPSATLTVTRADLHRSNSAHSAQSDVSDSGAQYLTVHTDYNSNNLSPTGAGPPTPMSVRPFSPSESFAFPKPPRQSDDWTSIASRPQSLAARSHVSLTTPKTPRLPPLFPPALPSSNPFADPDAHLDLNDPFSDSDTAAAAAAPEFAERETIRRPFVPTLQDELGVQPGDDIHIVEIFDDGWAFVEKFVGDTNTVQRGLIPIDCLRDADQSLPSFLADKRVSSSYGYGGLAV